MQDFWEFQIKNGVWSNSVFGEGRTPEGTIAHLKSEVNELQDSPYDLLEYADCMILLLDSARLAGYDADTLLAACTTKLEINKKRKWGKVNEEGFVEHVEE